jgi:hypothetical protein
MGIFNKLFGGNKNKSESNQEIRLEYNVMKNIIIEKSDKYESVELYKLIESGIYEDLKDNDDTKYRITISYELESDDSDNQFPLEDVLDKYYLHVTDFYESENSTNSNKYKIELGGELEDIKNVQEIIGKRVFNRDFLDEDGEIRVNLIVE